MEDQSAGLRKGAWSREEDNILRQCIAEHGEGKWHQIPAAAGLNRCRKSCRLRWLNYLKPNIKRGDFEEDEVDLILKLHNLLGNRWSLIAGRLPGRTTNDVKNFWNMKQRQEKPRRLSNTKQKSQEIVKPITLRPKPQRLLSTSSRSFTGEGSTSDPIQLEKNISTALPTSSASQIHKENDWMKVLLEEEEEVEEEEESMQTTTSCYSLPINGLFTENHIQSGNSISCRNLPTTTAIEDQLDWWKTFLDQ